MEPIIDPDGVPRCSERCSQFVAIERRTKTVFSPDGTCDGVYVAAKAKNFAGHVCVPRVRKMVEELRLAHASR